MACAAGVAAQTPPATPVAADTAVLGKLFLNPERRQTLERQRQLNIREAESPEGDTLQLNGTVQRSSGRHTVWINQRVQHDDSANVPVNVRINRQNPARANVSTNNEVPTQLRVGESINRTTQERKDVVPPGGVNAGNRP